MILAFSLGFVTRHPGLLLVLIGVAGEVFFDWPEMNGKRAWCKRLSALVLVFGLLLEFAEAAKSDKEVARLNKDAADARLETTRLEEQISETRTNVAKIDPLNLTIADVVVSVNFGVKEKDFIDPPLESAVAYLELCETNMEVLNSNGSIVLSADKVERGLTVSPFDKSVIDYSYSMYFHSDPSSVSSPSYFNGKPASEIMEKVNALKIFSRFIPPDKSVIVGQAEMTINGNLHKHFFIGGQKTLGITYDESGRGSGTNFYSSLIMATAP
jgi:hypothetical protein